MLVALGDAERLLAGGHRWLARERMIAALDGRDDGVHAGTLARAHNLLGVVAKSVGELDEAAERYELASQLVADADDPLLHATVEHNLGGLAHARGDFADAERHSRRALERLADLVGDADQRTAAERAQLGSILSELGRHDEAIGVLRTAIEGLAAALGPDHVEVGVARTTLGAALHRSGRLDEAATAYAAGLAAREAAAGARHPDLAPALLNAGLLTAERGDAPGARALAQRAVEVMEGAVVEDHPLLLLARERAHATQVASAATHG